MQYLLGLLLALTLNVAWAKDKPATLSEFVEGMQSKQGYFDFFYQDASGKLYLQIDKAQLNQPFIFQSSLPYGVGSNDIGLDRGQLGQTRLVQFERFGKTALLKQLNTEYRAVSDNAAERDAVSEAFANSVIAGLDIVSQSDSAILVDYTPFLLSDIHQIGNRLTQRKQGKGYKVDAKRSGVYLERSKSFPNNTELEALVTFAGKEPGQYVNQVTPAPESISAHLHHSLIQLPDNGYQTRTFHPMSGYWSIAHADYATDIDESLVQRVIPRHRLEKKNPSAKVSEPVEPIVYYLDPGVPEPVRSALIDGAMWWDQAFEAIGYKNAFQVKDLPADADPMDVRYNTIQWVHRATRGWSYGMSVRDPRTGEILKGHVTLGSLRVRQDLLIALGLTSPFSDDAANIDAQKEMALARIRQLSAHEVGHTLGIAHNFAASENNRASVMDYPHPLLTLKDGKVDLSDAYDVGIGEWDKHVIAYGYQTYPTKAAEQAGLDQIIEGVLAKGLLYMSDPDSRGMNAANASGHLWDNGEDVIAEFENLLAIRATALNNFGLNSLPPGEPLSALEERLVPIYLMHRYQLEAVAKQIGGVTYSYELKNSKAKGVQPVDVAQQKRALDALLVSLQPENLALSDELLKLITPQAYGYQRTREAFKGQTGPAFDYFSAAESLSSHTLKWLLTPSRLNRLSQQNLDGFSVEQVLTEVIQNTVKSSDWNNEIAQRLSLVVADALVQLFESEALGLESRALVFEKLKDLEDWLSEEAEHPSQAMLASWLDTYFDEGEWKGKLNTAPLPPGSPI